MGRSARGVSARRDLLGLQQKLWSRHREAIFDVGDEPVRAEVRTLAAAIDKNTKSLSFCRHLFSIETVWELCCLLLDQRVKLCKADWYWLEDSPEDHTTQAEPSAYSEQHRFSMRILLQRRGTTKRVFHCIRSHRLSSVAAWADSWTTQTTTPLYSWRKHGWHEPWQRLFLEFSVYS